MDPVTLVFSSFLNTITNTVHSSLTDSLGLELKATVVEYQAQPVDYQFQNWRIKPDSVCEQKKLQLVSVYSECTLAAKQLFQETCAYLNQHARNTREQTNIKNMYCTAAATYTPVVASISIPDEVETEIFEAKQKCSLLTLEAGQTTNPGIKKRQNQACDEAKLIREKYGQL